MLSYLPTMHHPNLSSAGMISSSVITGTNVAVARMGPYVKADRQGGEEVLVQQEYVNH